MSPIYTVSLTKIIEKMELKNCSPQINTDNILIDTAEVNRPALQLTGFYDNFMNQRVQILGYVEYLYLQKIQEEKKLIEIYEKFFSSSIPCLIISSGMEPSELMLEISGKYGVPVLTSSSDTSDFMADIIGWLKVELAPRISIHGVLVDVYGEGVLIMGESGIGKSEAALELIKRGHRLVSDDVVEIKKVSKETLVGSSPEITRHLIELRGIGIVDVKTLFGVQSVKLTQQINLVIRLEEWQKGNEYDRMGLEEQYIEFLGNKVVSHTIPVRPGRNLAIVVESAAINYRTKRLGYNAAKELYNRVTGNMMKKDEE